MVTGVSLGQGSVKVRTQGAHSLAFATERPLGFPTGAVSVEQWEQELLQREEDRVRRRR